MQQQHTRHPYQCPSSEVCLDEELGPAVDSSLDSSLDDNDAARRSAPRYAVYPRPPRGARSLIGDFVSLNGESVQVSVAQQQQQQHDDNKISSSNPSGPPSVVHISSSDSSSLGGAFPYDSLTTFRILGSSSHNINPSRPRDDDNDTAPSALSQRPPTPGRRKGPAKVSHDQQPSPLVIPHKGNKNKDNKGSPIQTTPRTQVSPSFSYQTPPVAKAGRRMPPRTDLPMDDDYDDDIKDPRDSNDCCFYCCPNWMRRSPLWLKYFLTVTLVFLLASSVLIGVALHLAWQQEEQPSSQRDRVFPESPSAYPPPVLPQDPQPQAPPPTPGITSAPSAPSAPNIFTPPIAPAPAAFPVPTAVPTGPPSTTAPTFLATMVPTDTIDFRVTTFYVTAGAWDDRVDPSVVLPRMPVRERRTFVVHLGGWNEGAAPRCDEANYQAVTDLWSQSACPVYFCVGDTETNQCEAPGTALDLWRDNLASFHDSFWQRPRWTFWDDNWSGFPETFVFEIDNVVVCGLHLTAGSVTTVDRRPVHEAALDWIDTNYDFYRRNARLFIILANAPVDDPTHADMFTTLWERMGQDYRALRFVYVQPGETAGQVRNYRDLANLDVVTVARRTWPPLQLQVNTTDDLVWNQDDWFAVHTGL
jgi:hypothetical protein